MNININRSAYIFSIVLSVLIMLSVIITNTPLFFILVSVGILFVLIVSIDSLRTPLVDRRQL